MSTNVTLNPDFGFPHVCFDTNMPIQLTLSAEVSSPRSVTMREMTPVETRFHLGKELMRAERLSDAEAAFRQAKPLAPGSPLPW